jgi:hypothetical protein
MTCPKCSGQMQSGFIIDRAGPAASLPERWVEGPPTLGFWRHGVSMQGREPLPVTTFRCDGCGYLESFAVRGESRSSAV